MCGIWGIINTEYAPFDYKTFCVLGIANDKRGGDSCGVFIDENVEYGIGKTALFEAFYPTSKLLKTIKRCRIAIGHDRKASSGGVSLEKAQPVIIRENDEIKFVLIHNGTIYNYEELAKKYIPDINITGMSDTQVLAQLLYHHGYDVLSEYNGGTAFVAIDYRDGQPRVFLFRGESKKYSTYGQPEEERPLYLNYKNGRLVFSSIYQYIPILDGGHCYVLPPNEIIEYRNSKLWKIEDIDRSKCIQTRATTSYNYSSGYGYGAYGGYPDRDGYDEDDVYQPPIQSYMQSNRGDNTFGTKTSKEFTGKIRLSSYGRMVGEKEVSTAYTLIEDIWFFHGIPMISEKAYSFVQKMYKDGPLAWIPFFSKYQNFIRYLSLDPIYSEGNLYLEATGPFTFRPFSGKHQILFQVGIDTFQDGKFLSRAGISGDINEPFRKINSDTKVDYDALWQTFTQSIA